MHHGSRAQTAAKAIRGFKEEFPHHFDGEGKPIAALLSVVKRFKAESKATGEAKEKEAEAKADARLNETLNRFGLKPKSD